MNDWFEHFCKNKVRIGSGYKKKLNRQKKRKGKKGQKWRKFEREKIHKNVFVVLPTPFTISVRNRQSSFQFQMQVLVLIKKTFAYTAPVLKKKKKKKKRKEKKGIWARIEIVACKSLRTASSVRVRSPIECVAVAHHYHYICWVFAIILGYK